ncbi:hypothetical protein MMC18_004214 [Xylographa bjoerkii]|nr:hypothetical protein [Xylographa bjoerkii]
MADPEKDGGIASLPTAENVAVAEVEYVTGWRFIAVGIAIVLSMFLTIIATALPHITDEFHSLDDGDAAQSLWGNAFKYFSIKTVYPINLAIFELGSLICGVAQNSTTLIVGRAVTGFGVAGTFVGPFVIIGFSALIEKRPAMTGLMSSAYAMASVIGH